MALILYSMVFVVALALRQIGKAMVGSDSGLSLRCSSASVAGDGGPLSNVDPDVLEAARAEFATDEGKVAMVRLHMAQFGHPELPDEESADKYLQGVFLYWVRSQQALKNSLNEIASVSGR
jgi:hypothetical protein